LSFLAVVAAGKVEAALQAVVTKAALTTLKFSARPPELTEQAAAAALTSEA
jgi:hypothetical protein